MIDEKKLIEDLLHNDGIVFEIKADFTTKEKAKETMDEFIKNMKQGFINLINAQPKIIFGVDLASSSKDGAPK